jgi:hypothetical protein
MTDRYDAMLIRRTMDGEGKLLQVDATWLTLHQLLARFIATGQTFEILGYNLNTTTKQRIEIFYDTREAEEREYP